MPAPIVPSPTTPTLEICIARDPNREETAVPHRPGGMTVRAVLALALVALVVVGLAGALADVARGRRPALTGRQAPTTA
jgi:hypothetical protein